MTDSRVFVHDMKNFLGIIIGFSNLLLDELPAEDPRRADLDEIRKAGEGAWRCSTMGRRRAGRRNEVTGVEARSPRGGR